MFHLFRKKEKREIPLSSLYQKGDRVLFHHRDDAVRGYVDAVYYDENHSVVYDIQIGGECPAIVTGVPENGIIGRR